MKMPQRRDKSSFRNQALAHARRSTAHAQMPLVTTPCGVHARGTAPPRRGNDAGTAACPDISLQQPPLAPQDSQHAQPQANLTAARGVVSASSHCI